MVGERSLEATMEYRKRSNRGRFMIGALVLGVALATLAACGGDDGGGYAVAALAARAAQPGAKHDE